MVAVVGLLLMAATATSWARFEAELPPEDDRRFEPVVVSGLSGPFGMGGKLVAGLGLLAAGAAAMIVFTRGRSVGLTASRWLVYCAGFFVLALYFLVRAWMFDDPVGGVIQGGDEAVQFVKAGNLYGLVVALVLGCAGALIALVGSYVARR